jgi:hypothetical protein
MTRLRTTLYIFFTANMLVVVGGRGGGGGGGGGGVVPYVQSEWVVWRGVGRGKGKNTPGIVRSFVCCLDFINLFIYRAAKGRKKAGVRVGWRMGRVP